MSGQRKQHALSLPGYRIKNAPRTVMVRGRFLTEHAEIGKISTALHERQAVSTSRKGGDAYVANAIVSNTSFFTMFSFYAIHMHHKSKIAAPAKETAIFFDT